VDQSITATYADIKDALASAALLCYPIPDAPICVRTDTFDVSVGAMLPQYYNSQ